MVNMVEERKRVKDLLKNLEFRKYTEGEDEIYLGKLKNFIEKFNVDVQSYQAKSERLSHNLFRLYNKLMVSGHLLEKQLQEAYNKLDYSKTDLEKFEEYLKENTRAYEYIDFMSKTLSILERHAKSLSSYNKKTLEGDVPGLSPFYNDFTFKRKSISEKKDALRELSSMETSILLCYGRILFDFHRLGLKYSESYGKWLLTYKSHFDPDDVFNITINVFGDIDKATKAFSGSRTYANTMNFYYKTIYDLTIVLDYSQTKNALVMRNLAENHVITAFTLDLYEEYTYTHRDIRFDHREGENFETEWYKDVLLKYTDHVMLIIRNILIRSEYDFNLTCAQIDNVRARYQVYSNGIVNDFYHCVQSLLHTSSVQELRTIGFYTIDVLEHAFDDIFKGLRTFQ